ncbi:hypothetical protein GCM10027167_25600 [Nocardia heshunensis]
MLSAKATGWRAPSPACEAIRVPITATPTAAPNSRAAEFNPAPMPERSVGRFAITPWVSTGAAKPIPNDSSTR